MKYRDFSPLGDGHRWTSKSNANKTSTAMAPETLPPQRHPLDKFEHLSISYHDSIPFVTVVALNRPEKRNAINSKMWKEIGSAFRSLGTIGDNCRCILLTGKGKGFCGGIDITDEKFFSGLSPDSGKDLARQSLAFKPQIIEMQSAFTAVEQCPVPVVAVIHGACIGAGVDLVCCADVRVCSSDAKFSTREVRLGLAADVGTLQRLPKLVGHTSRVRELCLTGEDFGAEEAYRIGFVSRISESGNLINTANEVVSKITQNSPVAVAVTKSSLNYSRDHTVSEGLDHVALQNSVALMTEDLVKSFMAGSGSADGVAFDPMLQHSRL